MMVPTVSIDSEFAALIPPLTSEERAQLETSLRTEGCRDALVTWQANGGPPVLLDGHNRLAICREHNLPFTTVTVSDNVKSRTDAMAWIVRTQLARRNLVPYQRAELVLKLEPLIAAQAKENQRQSGGAVPQKSEKPPLDRYKEMGKLAGVSHDTMAKVKVIHETAPPEVKAKVSSGRESINKAYRDLKRAESAATQRERLRVRAPHHGALCQIFTCPVARLHEHVPPESIDWIITDPPYSQAHIAVYDDLATFGERVLKPGGSLLCMIGGSYLLEIAPALNAKLRFHWPVHYLTPGGQAAQVWDRRVNSFAKLVLWFAKGTYAGRWIGDVVKSAVNDNDKRFHQWGQSESGIADLIERFTEPRQVICDPFCGGGTTPVAAVRLGRQCIAADVDPKATATTRARLEGLEAPGAAIVEGADDRRHWSGLHTPDLVDAALAGLAASGWLRLEDRETGGRPSRVVRLHPDFLRGAR